MTLRLDDGGGVIAVDDNGQEESLFGASAAQEEEAKVTSSRRYEVYVQGKLAFRSKNKCGDRVKAMLLSGVPSSEIKVVDTKTGKTYGVGLK